MATRKNTKNAVAVATREETHAEVDATTSADATGREIAAYLVAGLESGEERIFNLARFAHAGLSIGAKPAEVAKSIAAHAARMIDDDNRRDFALANSVTKGGVNMTGNAVKQYSFAWAAILQGGMVPSVATVVLSFRAFTSAGAKGLAEAHGKLLEKVAKMSEGERDAYYLANAKRIADAIKKASKAAKSENAATDSADDKAEAGEPVILDSIDEIRSFVEATIARPWNDDDKATLAAIFANAAESLA